VQKCEGKQTNITQCPGSTHSLSNYYSSVHN